MTAKSTGAPGRPQRAAGPSCRLGPGPTAGPGTRLTHPEGARSGAKRHQRSSLAFSLLGLLALGLAACSSPTPNRIDELDLDIPDFKLRDEVAERQEPEEIGALMIELDSLIQSWNSAKLGTTDTAARKRRVIENDIGRVSLKRFDDLRDQLMSGSPRNRAIAAGALGFSRSPDAIDLLIAVIDSDSAEISNNALFGLGILGSPDVPVTPLLRLLRTGEESKTRINAAFALQRTLAAGPVRPEDRDAIVEGLLDSIHDTEAGVRVQVISCLRVVMPPEAVDNLGDRLYDEEELSALAAARALTDIGLEHGEVQGDAARHLYDAYIKARPSRKDLYRNEMMRLSKRNFGERDEDWRDWAYRLP